MTSAHRDDTAPPQRENALRDAVLDRLAALEHITEDGALEARLPLARSELHRLADGWRILLTVHSAGPDGRCRACPGWLRRRRPWPCQVWLMAHEHLLGETPPARERFPLLRRIRRRDRDCPDEGWPVD